MESKGIFRWYEQFVDFVCAGLLGPRIKNKNGQIAQTTMTTITKTKTQYTWTWVFYSRDIQTPPEVRYFYPKDIPETPNLRRYLDV